MEIKKLTNQIDTNKTHLHDKLNHLKQCSSNQQSKKKKAKVNKNQ